MTRPLRGADAQVLDLLAHVVIIGEHRGTPGSPLWDAADVRRVAAEHLYPRNVRLRPPPTEPAPRTHHRRERPKPAPPIPEGAHRPVELTPRLNRILELLRDGHAADEIAAELHIARNTAANAVALVSRALGAVDRHHAVALVQAGAVDIRVKSRKGKAA